jgi:hypothetical protein
MSPQTLTVYITAKKPKIHNQNEISAWNACITDSSMITGFIEFLTLNVETRYCIENSVYNHHTGKFCLVMTDNKNDRKSLVTTGPFKSVCVVGELIQMDENFADLIKELMF